jgi:adenine-specific DNA-methyltransferase
MQEGAIDGRSLDIQDERLEALRKYFPEIFTEDKVDGEKLKASLGSSLEEGSERYGLNWAGKSACFAEIQRQTTAALLPELEQSVNFDTTENIFIEGENLEVLKVLQKSYFGKVKMIYIDPPYNTGKDFVYRDSFSQSREEYEQMAGDSNDEGIFRDFQKNSKDNGRYHSNWLNMMYPRLYTARNLLREDGAIFVSIDENEIFGEENLVGSLIWHKKLTGGYDNNWINTQHEYILIFAKNKEFFDIGKEKKESKYTLQDEEGKKYKWDSLWTSSLTYSASLDYQIEAPDGTSIDPVGEKGRAFWLWSKNKVEKERHLLKFQKDKNGEWKVYKRVYASEDGLVPSSVLDKIIVGGNTHSAREMKEIFGDRYFDYAKPVALIRFLIERGNLIDDDIVLDFFAGSGTTAHAVMDLNDEDGVNRKWICVQLPEVVDELSEAYKAGYKNIAEISRERIRRAGAGIAKGDIGFKSFRLTESNFKIWQSVQMETGEDLQAKLEDFLNPDSDGSDDAKLYEVLLKAGYDLNSQREQKNGFVVINQGELVVSFISEITQGIIDEIITLSPRLVILQDTSFAGKDELKTNTILQMKSKQIELRVI